MRVRKWLALPLVTSAIAAMSVGSALAAPNNHIDFIRGYGSDTTYGLMQQLDVAFNGSLGCPNAANAGRTDTLTSNPDGSCTPPATSLSSKGPENWDHDVAISDYPVGSGNGIVTLEKFGTADFCGGTTGEPYPGNACAYIPFEYARSSRARGGSDDTTLRFVAYAKDAIPWVNWRSGTTAEANGPAAGVTNLSTQNLKDIFTNCAVHNWSDSSLLTHPTNTALAGTPADTIIVWADQAGSGTRKSFDGFLGTGGNSTNCIQTGHTGGAGVAGSRIIFENNASPIVNCTTGTGGSCDATDGTNTYLSSIYYFSTGPYAQTPIDTNHGSQHGNGADVGSIDSIAPTSSNIESNAFTFSRLLFNVYRNNYSTGNNIPVPALDYIGETGWICKGSNGTVSPGLPDNVNVSNGDTDVRGGHILDPNTGNNYSTEITGDTAHTTPDAFDGLIKTQGFVPLSFGAIGGTVAGNSHCRVS